MNLEQSVLKVIIECKVQSFPIDCVKILEHYGYKIYTYNKIKEKNPLLYEMCSEYSADSFVEKNSKLLAYNSDRPAGRINFSLMHELGHHIIEHKRDDIKNEREANAFASLLLAPRMAIHYSGCKNANDVSKIFNLTHEAAIYAFDDYRKWHRKAIYKMSDIDKLYYSHFYSGEKNCFVWSIKKCDFCGKTLYNSVSDRCNICTLPEETAYSQRYARNSYCNDNDAIFKRQEHNWLYSDYY